MKRNITTILILNILFLGLVCYTTPVIAEESQSNILQGHGKYYDPYLITSVEELIAFANDVNSGNSYDDKYIHLKSDIDLIDNEWIPIGNSLSPFKGNFFGNGFSIYNMHISQFFNEIGFFGYFDHSTSGENIIRDVIIHGTIDVTHNVVGEDVSIGLLVGYQNDLTFVDNCSTSGTVNFVSYNTYQTNTVIETASSMLPGVYQGGLVGQNKGEIYNCGTSIILTGTYSYVGEMGSESNNDSVNFTLPYYCGGLVGYNTAIVRNSFVEIQTLSITSGTINNGNNVLVKAGGLVGEATSGAIENGYVNVLLAEETTESAVTVPFQINADNNTQYSFVSDTNLYYIGVLVGYLNEATLSNGYCFYNFDSAAEGKYIPNSSNMYVGYTVYDANLTYCSGFLSLAIGDSNFYVNEGIAGSVTPLIDNLNQWIIDKTTGEYWRNWVSVEGKIPQPISTPFHVCDIVLAIDNNEITITCLTSGCTEDYTTAIATVKENIAVSLEYSGNSIEPLIIEYNETWPSKLDLEITYANNINAGVAIANISHGDITASTNFTILPTSLPNDIFSIGNNFEYTGEEIFPEITCSDPNITETVDYTVEYRDNIEIGYGIVVIQGIGNYDDNISLMFEITEKGVEDANKSIEDTNKLIEDILSGNTDDPNLQWVIEQVAPEIIEEVTSKSQDELEQISNQLSNGEISAEEAKKKTDIVSIITTTSLTIIENKDALVESLQPFEEESVIPLSKHVESLFQNQFDELLKYDYDIDLETYENVIEFTYMLFDNMQSAVGTIHDCDGESMKMHVGTYVEELSAKTFRNYNQSQADQEFVEMTYQAILYYLQEQTRIALEESYQFALESGNYNDTELKELTKIYQGEKEKILNIEVFEDIVLEVLRQQYLTLINDKAEKGDISTEELEELIKNAHDVDAFHTIYMKIFEDWALNVSEPEISLEELTTTVIKNNSSEVMKIEVNKTLTKKETIVIATFTSSILTIGVICLFWPKKEVI